MKMRHCLEKNLMKLHAYLKKGKVQPMWLNLSDKQSAEDTGDVVNERKAKVELPGENGGRKDGSIPCK